MLLSIELSEYKLKAGYIYNIMKFISWQEVSGKVIKVAVYGADPFDGYLDTMQSKRIKNHSIKVVHTKDIEELKSSDVVFISANNALPDLVSHGVLTIGDSKEFLHNGGMIELKVVASKIKIGINLDLVQKEQINISSKLLNSSIVEIYKGE